MNIISSLTNILWSAKEKVKKKYITYKNVAYIEGILQI